MLDARARPIRDAGRDHTAVGVADQDHVVQILRLEHRDDVLDMRVEAYIRVAEMRALAEARVGRRPQLVTGAKHQRAHLLPRPAGRPRAMRHHECCHASAPCLPRRAKIYKPAKEQTIGRRHAAPPFRADHAAGRILRLVMETATEVWG